MDRADTEDVLNVIPDSYLPILQEIYRDFSAATDHIYNYLSSIIRWKKLGVKKEYVTILVTEDWKTTGTFIGINKYFCSELFIATLQEGCESLSRAISETNRIEWSKPWLIYSMYGRLYPHVKRALENTSYDLVDPGSDHADIWWTPKEKAVKLCVNCPDDVYIAELQPSHAEIINPVWPPRYPNSQNYLKTLIQMNGGYGIFLKSNHELVAWAIRNQMGLGALQTVAAHRQKGYGVMISSYLAKKLAEEGFNPLGTVRHGNVPSEKMFTRMGFAVVGEAYYLDNKVNKELEESAK